MLKYIIAMTMAFSFAASANHDWAGPSQGKRNEWNRRRPVPPRRPVPRPPARDIVEVVGQATLGWNDQWTYVSVNSCNRRSYMNGDQIQLELDNWALADIEVMEVEFGDGRRGRQRIDINKRAFTPEYPRSSWQELRGSKRTDRCVRGVWIWGKTVRSRHNRDLAVINILLKDIREPGQW